MSPNKPSSSPQQNPPEGVQSTRVLFDQIPYVQNLLEGKELHDVQTMNLLTDQRKWIEAFRDHSDVLEKDDVKVLPLEPFGPRDLLLSLPLEQRQEVYLQYIDEYIPRDIQNEMGIAQDENASVQDRIGVISRYKAQIDAALGAVNGLEDWDSPVQGDTSGADFAKQMAKKSVEKYYDIQGATRISSEEGLQKLQSDFGFSLSTLNPRQVREAGTDIAKMSELLISEVRPSRLRGAVSLGIVNKTMLKRVAPDLDKLEYMYQLSEQNVRGQLERLTGESNERVKSEIEGVRHMWDSMHPAIRLLLIGAGIALGAKTLHAAIFKNSGRAQFATGLVAAVYLAQKFLLKHENAAEPWAKAINNVSNVARGATDPYLEEINQVEERTKVVMPFLDRYSGPYLERQAMGFTFLYDLPLKVIAKNFTFDGQHMRFDVRSDSVQRLLKDDAKGNHWRNGVQEFFKDEENRKQATEAISYVFFKIGSELPQNEAKKDLVMSQLKRLPLGTSLSIFGQIMNGKKAKLDGLPNSVVLMQDKGMVQAAQVFRELFEAGKMNIRNSQNAQTLGEYIIADKIDIQEDGSRKSWIEGVSGSLEEYVPRGAFFIPEKPIDVQRGEDVDVSKNASGENVNKHDSTGEEATRLEHSGENPDNKNVSVGEQVKKMQSGGEENSQAKVDRNEKGKLEEPEIGEK